MLNMKTRSFTIFVMVWIINLLVSLGLGQNEESNLKKLAEGTKTQKIRVIKKLAKSEPSDAIIDALIKSLSESDKDVRFESARALGKFGSKASKAVPHLIAGMKDYEVNINGEKLWVEFSKALRAIGKPSVAPMIKALDSDDIQTFWGSCQALADIGWPDNKEALPDILERVQTEKGDRLYGVIVILESFGANAKDATGDVIRILKEGGDTPKDSKQLQNQMVACRTLRAIGKDAREAKPLLIRLTKEGVVSTRGLSALALGAMAKEGDDDILEALMSSMSDFNQTVRERSVLALTEMGPLAKKALPKIESAFSKEDSFASKPVAALAYYKISGESEKPIERLIELMEKPQHELGAIEALGDIGEAAASAIPDLEKKFVSSRDISIHETIVRAFGKIGPKAASTRKLFEKQAKHADKQYANVVAETLKKFEEKPKEATDDQK